MKRILPGLVMVILLIGHLQASFAAPENLFGEGVSTPKAAIASKANRAVARQRVAPVNNHLLTGPQLSLQPGSKIVLNLFDGEEYSVTIDKLKRKGSATLITQGVVEGSPLSRLILVNQNGALAGSFTAPNGKVYDIAYAGEGLQAIREITPSLVPECSEREFTNSPVAGRASATPAPQVQSAADTTPPVIDILVVYTPAARDGAGGDDAIGALIELAVEQANTAFANSGIKAQLHLVYSTCINYTDSGNISNDLDRLTQGTLSSMAQVHSLRDRYKADVVSMIVESSDSDNVGISWRMGDISTSFSDHAYNVVLRSYATSTYTFTHELGHIFGCRHAHDDTNDDAAGLSYAYGYRFQDGSGYWSKTASTIMAYIADGGYRILFFSSPNLTYMGIPIGTADANNALAINTTAATVASFENRPSLASALDSTGISWTTGGTAPWIWQAVLSHDGADAAQSGEIASGEDSWFEGTVTGPGQLDFWWKVSSAPNSGTLNFMLDETTKLSISGEQDWKSQTLMLPSGTHRLKWQYAKSSDSAAGADAAWVDQVRFVPSTAANPTVAISSPAANTTVNTPFVTIKGTASDTVRLTSIQCQISDLSGTKDWIVINGASQWAFDLCLTPGTNTITVKAVDSLGKESKPVSRTVFYEALVPLTLVTNGSGKITRSFTGTNLAVGRNYSVTAVPNPGNWFEGWQAQTTTSTQTVLKFMMQSNLQITANFTTNLFRPRQGTFTGLFFNTNGPDIESSGSFSFKLTEDGKYSGKLLQGTRSYSFSGQIDRLTGRASATATSSDKKTLVTTWQLDLTDANDRIDGTVTGQTWTAQATGNRPVFNAKASPSPWTGTHSLIFPSMAESGPAGYGYGTLTIDASGSVALSGMLADGTPLTPRSTLSSSGRWPLYVSLASGKGMILGWVCVNDTTTDAWDNRIVWQMPAAKYCGQGFTNQVPLCHFQYVAPTNGTSSTNQWVLLTKGNLNQGVTNAVSFAPNGTYKVAQGNRITLTIAKNTIKGTFWHPDLKKLVNFNGVIFQDRSGACGFFLGTNEGGLFELSTSMAPPKIPGLPEIEIRPMSVQGSDADLFDWTLDGAQYEGKSNEYSTPIRPQQY